MSQKSAEGLFTKGSIWRHIIVMTLTGAIGLFAVMMVDFIDLLYIKALGVEETAAAIGFSGNVLFYITSINIGISIAAGVLIGRAMGKGETDQAKVYSINFYVLSFVLMILLAIGLWWLTPDILRLLGATGQTLELATAYLRIMWFSAPMFVLGFCGMAILRAVGDARRAMQCTLVAALVNAVLDPFFIFDRPLSLLGIDAAIGFGWGIEGAAWASVIARCTMAVVALHGTIVVHKMRAKFHIHRLFEQMGTIGKIAVPAMLTNFATPIGDSFVTRMIAAHGTDAVAAYAVIGRLIPIAFAATFALSGSIGPIIAQNLGAKYYHRVHEVISKSLAFVAIYVLSVSALLWSVEAQILMMFNANEHEARIIRFFLHFISFSFIFVASIFVCNACFNNMGKPMWATVINFARALGAIPFLYVGGLWFEANGVLAGQAIWAACVAIISTILAYQLLGRIAMGDTEYQGVQRYARWGRVPMYSYGMPKMVYEPSQAKRVDQSDNAQQTKEE